MIVKILSSSPNFAGVSYNTEKIDKDKGELMLAENFGPLQGLDRLRPEDYRNYLQLLAAQNKRVKNPQFHAAISAKGQTYDKYALTEIAVKWLTEMGYGRQPYLIVYHRDTKNNHVHAVSVRVGRDGKKINSGFEKIRAVQNLNKVMEMDETYKASRDIHKALGFQFSTQAQFMMVLESMGYVVKESAGQLQIIKYGKKLQEIPLAELQEQISRYHKDADRQKQLKAIFEKYRQVYRTDLSADVKPLPGGLTGKPDGYSSPFSEFLKAKLGIALLFHSKDGKPPYGYSVIDHREKTVWKGNEIMPLKTLLESKGTGEFIQAENEPEAFTVKQLSVEENDYYAALLKASLNNYPDFNQGLRHQGLILADDDGTAVLVDNKTQFAIPVSDLLTETELADFQGQYESPDPGEYYIPPVSISADIDDEAINGRNRRRKKKARTNSR
ncbi:relaxase/mobilization nuclease domain-containing protein [Pedobacter sp. ISL-68]|uniref:relaxase/mobilization nuclease domain-containing protein n=1 Tax=unclassified Pedobacter TaxID=2628915 RepID=UPI001BE7512A|nr:MULTISPECIES: relaxase/mobilization nuclease domain-containing protein [unclassified Pedobacter]MBT2560116.1 relaxase/mobilization nuclease domain-containing protein [Pedobacter sp. ISL-64]MBT2589095.1 relaxase/mobilization nuclease domain-containing protein [Pedobacter sp. ISL-68]